MKKLGRKNRVQDVFRVSVDRTKGTLDLRLRDYIPKRERPLWRILTQIKYLAPVFGAIVIAIIGVSVFQMTQAQVARFYSSSCLGDWQNTSHAEGEPNSGGLFNFGNSAVWNGAGSGIFCGDFDGELPTDSKPSKVTLMFSWQIGEQRFDEESGQTSETGNNTSASGGSSGTSTQNEETNEVDHEEVSTTTEESSDLEEEAVNKTETDTDTNVDTEEESKPEPESAEPGDNPEESASKPGKLYGLLIPEVYAQEVEPTETIETPDEVTEDNGLVEEEIDSDVVEDAETDTEISEEVNLSSVTGVPDLSVPDDKVFLEVYYTLDGDTWEYLAGITKANWQNSLFPLPVESWHDLTDMQIQLRNVAFGSEYPDIFLDSMWLEAEYEGAPIANILSINEERLQTLQEVHLNLGEVGPTKHFEADSAVDFELSIPSLSQGDIDSILNPEEATTTASTSLSEIENIPVDTGPTQEELLEEFGTTTEDIVELTPMEIIIDTMATTTEEQERFDEFGTTTEDIVPLVPVEEEVVIPETDIEDTTPTTSEPE